MALAQGTHVVCLDRFDARQWLGAVEQYQVNYAYIVPTMMSRIAKLPEPTIAAADLSSLQWCCTWRRPVHPT